MPVQTSYPGVYIEELPGGIRTITGVATSITAFIGRAKKGPVNEPVTIRSYADFERQFGGLWIESTMSYAVQDFYQNGGSEAIIVRIYNAPETPEEPGEEEEPVEIESTIATINIPMPGGTEFLMLSAKNPGSWGKSLSVSIDHQIKDPTSSTDPPSDSKEFNLIIYEKNSEGVKIKAEEYHRVTLSENDLRFLPRMLEQSSDRLQVNKTSSGNWAIPTTDLRPDAATVESTGGTDGLVLETADYEGNPGDKTGIYALNKADLFNLLCIPPPQRGTDTAGTTWSKAVELCVSRRAMLIIDSPAAWASSVNSAVSNPISNLSNLQISGTNARNAILYYPLIKKADPLRNNQTDLFVPCGAIAGAISQTDSQRGVWKAPAGNDVALNGVQGLQINLSDNENGALNKIGINCLRSFPLRGNLVWGARTLRGADQLADEWKYVPVRRTALFLEESLYRGSQWVVFEPNDEPLWAQIRLNIGAFMHNLFRQGAFQGKTPREAYLVKCDKETTTQNDINNGIVNILVGFAPLKPAEFVIIKIQQLAGQIES